MSTSLRELEGFLALSRAMAGAAAEQDWDGLVRLGKERGTLADRWPINLSAQLPPAEQALARIIIEQCQQLDVRIRSLTEERQKALRVLLRVAEPLT